MLQLFLSLIGLEHIRAFRSIATNVTDIQRVFAKGVTEQIPSLTPKAFAGCRRASPRGRCTLRMANSNSSEHPAWQRNPLFEFFASLKLAVVLLAVLIIAAIAGT